MRNPCRCSSSVRCSLAGAAAQETRGTISGSVQDAQGVVPGATVRITNTDTNTTQVLVTNNTGYFEAPLLQPGTYRIVVEMASFKTVTRDGVALAVGQQINLPFTLEVGSINEQVTVTGSRARARHDIGLVGREFRLAADQRAADVLEHACWPGALCPGRESGRGPATDVAGFRDRTERGVRHRDRRRRQQHIHDRRRDQRRLQSSALHLTERGHGSGDARRDVELRRVERARSRQSDLDDDARRHERDARNGQLSVLDEQAERAQRAAETDVQRRRARGVQGGPLAQLRLHARRTAPHSEARSTAVERRSSSRTIHTSTIPFPEETRATTRFRPTKSICRAISPTCCGCRVRRSTSFTTR